MGRTFHLIEIEFESPIISAEALLLVSDMLTMRQHRREQKEARERSLTRAKEAAEDLLLSLRKCGSILLQGLIVTLPSLWIRVCTEL